MSEVKAAGDTEIVGLRPADACILGVDAKAKAVDEFIDTITRTSIASLVAVSVTWWRALGRIR